MNIVLTGFMATGKTTVAKYLADMTGMKVIDTDEYIEQKEGRTINEIFASDGEEYFRRAETEAIKEAAQLDGYIISTGGGAVLREENIRHLRKSGTVFNLNPDFNVILERLNSAKDTRPLLKNSDIEQIRARFDARKPFYDNCDYSIHITSANASEAAAREITNILKSENLL